MSCGGAFTLALDIYGQRYSWGAGSTGALGNGFLHDVEIPKQIIFNNLNNCKIEFISSGLMHAAAIDS